MDVLLNNDVETVDFGETAMRVKLTREVIEVKEINDIGSVRILMLKGEKGDVGYPTDEQVSEAVDEWLTAHPEATTTVQDNSLTWVKFNDVLKNMMFKLGITDSKSGELVSTSDAAEFPLKDLQSEITATQNLNGYDYPWVGGAGKNKLNENWLENGYSLGANGLPTSTAKRIATTTPVPINGTQYTVSYSTTVNTVVFMYSLFNGDTLLERTANKSNGSVINTTGADKMYISLYDSQSSDITSGVVSKVQIEEGSTATTYAPYENICPISGRTEVNVTRTGANVWDEDYAPGVWLDNGTFWANTNGFMSNRTHIPVKPNTQYRFVEKNTTYSFYISYYTENKTFIRRDTLAYREETTLITTPSNCHFICFSTFQQYGTTYNNDIAVNYPSTATAYEPYEGDTFYTELGRTVYGGTLDLTTGVLTVNTGLIASYNGETIGEPWISDRDRYVAGTTPTVGAQVVYTKESETYQVDRTEVDAYFKNNTIWSDSGDVAVSYLVDAKTYIDNQ